MSEELKFETFRYFLECYFNVSANYSELEKTINDFNSFENTKYRKKLLEELEHVLELKDWDFVKDFVRKYGMRKVDEKKLKWLINVIMDNLNSN